MYSDIIQEAKRPGDSQTALPPENLRKGLNPRGLFPVSIGTILPELHAPEIHAL